MPSAYPGYWKKEHNSIHVAPGDVFRSLIAFIGKNL